MGLKGGEKVTDIALDRVFIGSCTNGRIEDLRAAAKVVDGKTVNAKVNAMIVPGSGLVKEQAEAEGLDKIFVKAGFEWREPGCSMCLAMNPGQAHRRRALRLDLEPQFRGPPGLQGPHASGVARHGRRRRDRRPFRRRAGVEVTRGPSAAHPPAAHLRIKHRAARPVLQLIPIDAAPVEQRPRIDLDARRAYAARRQRGRGPAFAERRRLRRAYRAAAEQRQCGERP